MAPLRGFLMRVYEAGVEGYRITWRLDIRFEIANRVIPWGMTNRRADNFFDHNRELKILQTSFFGRYT